MDSSSYEETGASQYCLRSHNFVQGGQTEKTTPPFSSSKRRETSCRHQASISGKLLIFGRGRSGKIQEVRDVCQRESDGLHRFCVSLPYGNCVFNRVVSMYLMKLECRSVLHVMDRDTTSGATCFLARESSFEIWKAFLSVWVSPYVGYPE